MRFGLARVKRCSTVASTSFVSCGEALAMLQAIGRPWRSAIAMILLPFPRRVGPIDVWSHDIRYGLYQDIRYILPPRICGKGGPRPALPAAAPMLACVAAGDRSPAHTCAGSLPAVVPPLPPRERVVRPVLHTRTSSRLPSSASPSRSALAPCSPTDIPTPAPGPDSS